jgi:hypothetical protein
MQTYPMLTSRFPNVMQTVTPRAYLSKESGSFLRHQDVTSVAAAHHCLSYIHAPNFKPRAG